MTGGHPSDLNHKLSTSAILGSLFVDDGLFLKLLLKRLNNFIYCANLEFPELSFEVGSDDSVQKPQSLPQLREEMIFHAVVSPLFTFIYFPEK